MNTARLTDQRSSIQNLNGSFLQFDGNQKKLVDMSRQVLSSPRKHIIGEAFNNPNVSLSINVPWKMHGSLTNSNMSGDLQKSPS